MRTIVALVATGMLMVMVCAGAARADAAADVLAAAQAAAARQDYATELTLLRPLAEQGNAKAQTTLGGMYHLGQGVPRDYAEAARWFRKAAEQGDVAAYDFLGLMYSFGEGVPVDFAEAARWHRKAADQGDAGAQNLLGLMYADGRGVPKDDAEAVRWYRKAAEQGYAWAQFFLGGMYHKGEGVSQDDGEAARWFRKAAEQGLAIAQTILGILYAEGKGVPKDYVQAYMWLNLASVGGDKQDAQTRDSLEKIMTAEQLAEAQRRTAAWQPVKPGEQQTSAPPASAAKQEPAPPTGVSQLHRRSQQFIAALYITTSGPTDEASATLNNFYADTVLYYGKEMSRKQVITQVQRFLARWPIRQYKPKEGTVKIDCDEGALTCAVTGAVQFDVQSPLRNEHSTGEATFEYRLRFTSSYQQMPKITVEGGALLKRSVQPLSFETNGSPDGNDPLGRSQR